MSTSAGSPFFRSTGIIFRRHMRISLRNPSWIITNLGMPVLYLLLFGPLLKPLSSSLGATNAYTLFVPGLLVQLSIFGTLFTGFGILAESRQGVIEAQKVTPAPRASLLAGRVLRDITQLAAQSVVLIALSFIVGLRGSPVGLMLGFVLAIILGAAFASASNAIALTVKTEDVLAPLLNSVALPIMLLSGIMLPMTIGPTWLQHLSDFVVTKHIVNGMRGMLNGHILDFTSLWAVFWTLFLAIIGFSWGIHVFRKDNP